ncbi:MAG: hypothetical protein Q7R87_01225 [Nanoarchaeota archaeon]|nr:hypothetical protein [Nanoarchaeota archaeon]
MTVVAINMPQTKEMIITFIKTRGPSLPVHVAQYIKTSPLFVSAFLSELYREQKLLMSDLKVGSSSLYLLPGQEQMIENFTQFLNQKEMEAFNMVKKEKLLEDQKLPPAIRVAIRAIKDFAIPIKVKNEGNEILFWKYAFTPDSEIELIINPVKKEEKPTQPAISVPTHTHQHHPSTQIQQLQQTVQPIQLEIKVEERPLIKAKEEKPKKEKIKKKQESKFLDDLKDYLKAKDIEILEQIEEKSKEFTAKIRINDIFGKQEYFLIAKERKKVKEEDLTLVLHKANQNKMLALFMAPGDLDKKALDFIKEYKNLVKFEKLKF